VVYSGGDDLSVISAFASLYDRRQLTRRRRRRRRRRGKG